MNLRIFRPRVVELTADGVETEVSAASEHVIGPVTHLELEFLRGVGHATYKMANGVPVTESFELGWIYPDGVPEFLFVAPEKDSKEFKERHAVNAVTGSFVPTEEEKKEESRRAAERAKAEFGTKSETEDEKKKRLEKEKEVLAKMTPAQRAQFEKDLAENEKQAKLAEQKAAADKK